MLYRIQFRKLTFASNESKMKVVFMGTPEFAAICLDELLNSRHEVVGVVSVPDKPAGRGQKINQSAVTKLSHEKGLKLLQPDKLKNPEFISELQSLEADAFVVVAFRMLPKEVWQIPSKGTFNLHASLLPQYRGAAPINWAIINGETESGVTTFLIDEKIDTGNLLLMDRVKIEAEDDAGSLHDKLVEIGKKLIVTTLNELEEGNITPRIQDETEILKPAPKIFKDDCYIDWQEPIENIHNKIRGLSPYPAAWSYLRKGDDLKSFKIYRGRYQKANQVNEPLHSVSFEDGNFKIHLSDGVYFVDELQLENKKRMKTVDFLNGIQDKTNWFVGK